MSGDIEQSSITARSVRGTIFTFGSSSLTMIIGFARSILLARLLCPGDFGVVALALFFLSLVDRLRDFNFNAALIHRQEDVEEASATHFVLRVGTALIMVMIVVLVIPLLRRAYPDQPQLGNILFVLSLSRVLTAANSTPQMLLKKRLAFRWLAVLDVVSSVVMTVSSVSMAWAGFGVWSLVAESVSGSLVLLVGLWFLRRPWNLSVRTSLGMIKWYFTFGSAMFISSWLRFLLDQFDDFWVGTALGSQPLGFYSRAYEFARYPRRVVAAPLLGVFSPAFAEVQKDRLQLSKAFFRAGSALVRMGFLLATILVVSTPEFVLFFLGDKWLPMIVPFRLMIVYVLLDPIDNLSDSLLTAVGAPRKVTSIRVIQTILFIPSVIILAGRFGTGGVAVAADIMMVSGVVLLLHRVRQYVDVNLRTMFGWPILAVALCGLSIVVFDRHFSLASPLVGLVLKGGITFIVFTGVLLAAEGRRYIETLNTVRQVLQPLIGRRLSPRGDKN